MVKNRKKGEKEKEGEIFVLKYSYPLSIGLPFLFFSVLLVLMGAQIY